MKNFKNKQLTTQEQLNIELAYSKIHLETAINPDHPLYSKKQEEFAQYFKKESKITKALLEKLITEDPSTPLSTLNTMEDLHLFYKCFLVQAFVIQCAFHNVTHMQDLYFRYLMLAWRTAIKSITYIQYFFEHPLTFTEHQQAFEYAEHYMEFIHAHQEQFNVFLKQVKKIKKEKDTTIEPNNYIFSEEKFFTYCDNMVEMEIAYAKILCLNQDSKELEKQIVYFKKHVAFIQSITTPSRAALSDIESRLPEIKSSPLLPILDFLYNNARDLITYLALFKESENSEQHDYPFEEAEHIKKDLEASQKNITISSDVNITAEHIQNTFTLIRSLKPSKGFTLNKELLDLTAQLLLTWKFQFLAQDDDIIRLRIYDIFGNLSKNCLNLSRSIEVKMLEAIAIEIANAVMPLRPIANSKQYREITEKYKPYLQNEKYVNSIYKHCSSSVAKSNLRLQPEVQQNAIRVLHFLEDQLTPFIKSPEENTTHFLVGIILMSSSSILQSLSYKHIPHYSYLPYIKTLIDYHHIVQKHKPTLKMTSDLALDICTFEVMFSETFISLKRESEMSPYIHKLINNIQELKILNPKKCGVLEKKLCILAKHNHHKNADIIHALDNFQCVFNEVEEALLKKINNKAISIASHPVSDNLLQTLPLINDEYTIPRTIERTSTFFAAGILARSNFTSVLVHLKNTIDTLEAWMQYFFKPTPTLSESIIWETTKAIMQDCMALHKKVASHLPQDDIIILTQKMQTITLDNDKHILEVKDKPHIQCTEKTSQKTKHITASASTVTTHTTVSVKKTTKPTEKKALTESEKRKLAQEAKENTQKRKAAKAQKALEIKKLAEEKRIAKEQQVLRQQQKMEQRRKINKKNKKIQAYTTEYMIDIPEALQQWIQSIKNTFPETYITGGYVRDKFISKYANDHLPANYTIEPNDADLYIQGDPKKLLKLIPDLKVLKELILNNGVKLRRFKACIAGLDIDIMCAHISLKKFLQGFDYTLNAISCTEHGVVLDPLHYVSDLLKPSWKTIDPLETVFTKQPTMIFRGIRISHHLMVPLPDDIVLAMQQQASSICHMNFNIYLCNLAKIFLRGKAITNLTALRKYALLDAIIPFLKEKLLSDDDYAQYGTYCQELLSPIDQLTAEERYQQYSPLLILAHLLRPWESELHHFVDSFSTLTEEERIQNTNNFITVFKHLNEKQIMHKNYTTSHIRGFQKPITPLYQMQVNHFANSANGNPFTSMLTEYHKIKNRFK